MARLAMLRLTDSASPARKRWCTAIVLVAICALTVSVATRFGSPLASGRNTAVIENQSCWEPSLQHLLDNAATWIPPAVATAIFYHPNYHPHTTPSRPMVSSVVLEKNLYNRPPPSITSSLL